MLLPVIEGVTGNSIFELLKNQKDRAAFIKIFEYAGAHVAEYEKDGTEEGDLRRIVFSKENMKTLAQFMINTDLYHFDDELEKCVDNLLIEDGLTGENRNNCKEHFLQIVYKEMNTKFPRLHAYSYFYGINEKIDRLSDKVDALDPSGGIESWPSSDENNQGVAYQMNSERRETENMPTADSAVESNWLITDLFREKVFIGRKEEKRFVEEVLNSWKGERECYPGWLIIPYSYSEKLRYQTEKYSCWIKTGFLPPRLELEFCGEYIWRLQTGKFIYFEDIVTHIRVIWESYNPDDIITCGQFNYWFEIACFLLREYRESGQYTEWQKVFAAISKHKDKYLYGSEGLAVEEIKFAFHRFDLNKARRLLARCSLPANMYELRLQKCGLEAECGNAEDALEHVVKLKNDLMKHIRSYAVEEEIRIYSVYAATLWMESFLMQGNAFIKGEYEQNQEKINDLLDEMDSYKAFFDWYKILGTVKTDLLRWHVKKHEDRQQFDLDKEGMTIISSGNQCLSSYYLYRVIDTVSIPLMNNYVTLLGNMEMQWLESLQDIMPYLSMFLMLRGHSKDTIKLCYDRNHLRKMDQSEIISEARFVIDAVNYNLEELSERMTVGVCYRLRENLPIMLVRLASRCEDTLQCEILLLYKRISEQPEPYFSQTCNQYLQSLMKQVSERNKAETLGDILNAKIIEPSLLKGLEYGIDILTFYFRKKNIDQYKELIRIDQDTIENLLRDENDSSFVWRTKIRRLLIVNDLGLLTKQQAQRLTQKVWDREHIDENTNLPDLQDLLLWNLYTLDYSASNLPTFSIKSAILNKGLMSSFKTESGCHFTGGNVPYLNEIIAISTQMDKDFWTLKEVEAIYEDAIQYWQILKNKIRDDKHFFGFDEYEARARKIFYMLSVLYKSITGKMKKQIVLQVCDMIEEAKDLKLNVSRLEILFVPDSRKNLFARSLKNYFCSSDKKVTDDALITACYYIEIYPDEETAEELLEEIINILHYRKLPGLETALIMLHNLLYLNCHIFTLEHLHRVDEALSEIEAMTAYENCRDSETEIKEASSIRKSCMSLAYQISLRGGTDSFPGVKCWRNVYASDEFNDVKNEMLI